MAATLTTGALIVFVLIGVALVLFVSELLPPDITAIGYQTNLMDYGPGGYKFTDYVRVGASLQLLLADVTTLSIAVLWPP